jgi:RNA polymerase sigma-70 factor (ECF subfamily)
MVKICQARIAYFLHSDFATELPLATSNELSDFLSGTERRAFKQAMFAVRNEETALDIVQDAMLRLAESYGSRPLSELPMLFQRILQNAIRDYYRRSKVRSLWTSLLSSFGSGDEDADPLDSLPTNPEDNRFATPHDHLQQAQTLEMIEKEIEKLPQRQREAFILRYWEELDIAETAQIMKCSTGSVKTHCSRATHTLATALKAKGIEL